MKFLKQIFGLNSSKELKIIRQVKYILTFTSIGLVFLLIFALIAPRSTCGIGDTAEADLVCINMKSIANALKMFKLDNGVYPTTEEGNAVLVSNFNASKYPNYSSYGYLKRLPKDIWGKPIIYIKTKDGFELVSYGADRKKGGEDADIFYSECESK